MCCAGCAARMVHASCKPCCYAVIPSERMSLIPACYMLPGHLIYLTLHGILYLWREPAVFVLPGRHPTRFVFRCCPHSSNYDSGGSRSAKDPSLNPHLGNILAQATSYYVHGEKATLRSYAIAAELSPLGCSESDEIWPVVKPLVLLDPRPSMSFVVDVEQCSAVDS
jgi:hypothetical protein